MNMVQRISLFMIALVVSLPIVFAQELSINKFQGKDNVKGFSRVQDELTIEAITKIPGETIIDKEQVRLYVEDSYAFFDDCEQSGEAGYYICSFIEPEFEAYEPITFTIELRDDDENIVGSETKTLIVDNLQPVVTEVQVDPPLSNGDITVSYVVEDYGVLYGTTDDCSGVKTVTVTSGGVELATDAFEPGTCITDNVLELTVTEAGEQQVCVIAVDHVNFASAPKCTEVTIDISPPEIEALTILDDQGFELTHVHSGEERDSTVSVFITDDGEIDQTEVYANFKELNPNLPDFLPPDIVEGDSYSWENIPVSEVSPCKITVKAKDTLGNNAEEEFSCDVAADDTPPTVLGVVVDAERNGVPLYGFGTQLLIEFEDEDNDGNPGIGMQNGMAYLDMRAMNMGDFTAADFCTNLAGAIWRCSWLINPPLTTDEGSFTLILSEGTSDDLENVIGQSVSYEIIYDNVGPKPPQIMDFRIISGEAGIEYTGGAVRGDFVQYVVRSGEFTTASADFGQIGGMEDDIPVGCEEVDEDTEDCTFESMVDLSGPYTAEIKFTFYDDAKNEASTTAILEVYGIDDETDAKYWKTPPTVTCSPRVIDRATAALISPLVTCRVDLETPRDDITTLAIAAPTTPDDCVGDTELTLNDIYAVNNYEGSTHPYLFLVLEPKNYYVDNLNINCPLQVFSKRAVRAPSGSPTGAATQGDVVYYVSRYPQSLPVNMTLQFYNNPMEAMDDNINQRIEEAMDDGLANAEWISDLQKIMKYFELGCWAKVLITNVIGALYILSVAVGITELALKSNPVTAGAGAALQPVRTNLCIGEENVSEIYGETGEGIIKFLDALCSIVNCSAVGGKGGVEAYLGGGMPWCDTIKDFYKNLDPTGAIQPSTSTQTVQGSSYTSVNVKDSLVLSILCLCLPGIIYNLDKLRQIDCFKSVCLYDYVKQQGYPASFCDEMHDYLVCTFVMGEIFSLIPFVNFFDKLMDMVITFITDPWSIFTVALGSICNESCADETTSFLSFFTLCALIKTVSVVAEAIAAVQKYQETKDSFGSVGNTYCDRMEDIKDEMGV